MVSVLFVCMGNICRSPSAEGVFQHLVNERGLENEFQLDSCGTISTHTGEAPDARAQATARGRGIDISGLRARQYSVDDFEKFDYVIAMDNTNVYDLQAKCPPEFLDKISLFCQYARNHDKDAVPDPYYGGAQGFEHVYDLILDASDGLLDHMQRTV